MKFALLAVAVLPLVSSVFALAGQKKRLTLKHGRNSVPCAVINAGGATDFCARFLDAQEKLLKGFTLSVGDVGK